MVVWQRQRSTRRCGASKASDGTTSGSKHGAAACITSLTHATPGLTGPILAVGGLVMTTLLSTHVTAAEWTDGCLVTPGDSGGETPVSPGREEGEIYEAWPS